MKIGLIGCGGMGTTHNLALKALSASMDVNVTAIADCREEFLDRAAAHWDNAHKYTSGEQLIQEEELDLVHICLPSYLHAAHAAMAMKKGMHVFIEKPVCLTRQECCSLLQLKDQTGVQVMVGQVVRSDVQYLFLKNVYEQKRYGNLKSIVMHRISGDASWGYDDWFHQEEKSGTAVLDLHIHDIDFLRYLLGEPDSYDVRACAFESGLINQIMTTYRFKDVYAFAEGIWDVSPALPFSADYRACFEDATVIFDSTKNPSVHVYLKDGTVQSPTISDEFNVTDGSAGINISQLGPYYTEIKYFLECLTNGTENTVAPLEEGVKSVLLGIEELKKAKESIQNKQ